MLFVGRSGGEFSQWLITIDGWCRRREAGRRRPRGDLSHGRSVLTWCHTRISIFRLLHVCARRAEGAFHRMGKGSARRQPLLLSSRGVKHSCLDNILTAPFLSVFVDIVNPIGREESTTYNQYMAVIGKCDKRWI